MKHSHACISDIELAAYLDDRLSGKDKEAIDSRLLKEKGCQQAMSLMRETLIRNNAHEIERDAPEYLIEKAVHAYQQLHGAFDVVLSVAKNILSIIQLSTEVVAMTPLQAGALRRAKTGGATMTVVTKTFDAVVVEVGIERTSKNLCNFLLNVKERNAVQPSGGVRAELVSGGREYASCLLKGGEAIFEDIRPGRYDIIVKQRDAVCGRLLIRIDD